MQEITAITEVLGQVVAVLVAGDLVVLVVPEQTGNPGNAGSGATSGGSGNPGSDGNTGALELMATRELMATPPDPLIW